MKKTASALLLVLLLLLPLLFCACSSTNKEALFSDMGLLNDAEAETDKLTESAGQTVLSSDTANSTAQAAADRKLVTTVNLGLESTDYSGDIAKIETLQEKYGGYTENESSSGDPEAHNRYTTLTLRIPADQLEAFLKAIKGVGSTCSFNRQVEDITLNYVDTESRIKALETERESLLKLLGQTASVDQIIAVQSALSDVNYQLENYASQKRLMDNQVSYATVTVSINEVQRVTTPEKNGTWAQIKANLGDNLYAIGHGAVACFIWFVSALPYFIILAVIALLVLFIVRLRRNHKKKKPETKE